MPHQNEQSSQFNRWLGNQAIAALRSAQTSAEAIGTLEKTYFNGQKIAPDSERGVNTYNYFKSTLEQQLFQIRLNLARFNATNLLASHSPSPLTEEEIIAKLDQIEAIIAKYRSPSLAVSDAVIQGETATLPRKENPHISPERHNFFNLQGDFSGEDEQQIIQNLRNLRSQKKLAIRFLILLICIPLTVQVLSKNLIYSPLVNHFRVEIVSWKEINFKEEIIEQYFEEFARYKEILEIRQLLAPGQPITSAEIHEQLKAKAQELIEEAATKSQEGTINLLADITGLITFTSLIILFRSKFIITRQYLSRSFLGLKDITKVFIFILLTDMFVGFHSAHGWEVLLENLTGHFGLPENRQAVYLFIATIPVFLDSLFKLLIFNYFTRQSPTSVAILEKMQK